MLNPAILPLNLQASSALPVRHEYFPTYGQLCKKRCRQSDSFASYKDSTLTGGEVIYSLAAWTKSSGLDLCVVGRIWGAGERISSTKRGNPAKQVRSTKLKSFDESQGRAASVISSTRLLSYAMPKRPGEYAILYMIAARLTRNAYCVCIIG